MKVSKLDIAVGAVLAASGVAVVLMLLIDRAVGVRIAQTFPDPQLSVGATSPAGIAYLSPASGGREVWLDALDGNKVQLTDTGGKVFDFSVSTDGLWIVYSVVNEMAGIDLWMSSTDGRVPRLLVDCQSDRCTSPDWSADGERIAYGREQLVESALSPARIWTVHPTTGQTAALYQDSQILGHGPSWSPDGSLLAFYDGTIGGIRILDIESGDEQVLPSRMGIVGGWAPDGQHMMFNVLIAGEGNIVTGLQLADLVERSTTLIELEADHIQDYGVPAWSPTGEWVLIGMQVAELGPGKQLWLVQPDGSEARPLVEDSRYTHGGYKWDAWGRRIVYQRLRLGRPDAAPELRLYDLESGEDRLIASDASSAAWIP